MSMSTRSPLKTVDIELIEKFHKVKDFYTLSNLLGFNFHQLKRIFYEIRRQKKHYKEFFINKKSGGKRRILAPDKKLKIIQQKIAYVLSLVYLGRASVHGFRRGKNIITNAENHTQRKLLLNIDLENFFPTIHFGRVRGILQSRPYSLSKAGATIIAGFCCYDGVLPQGAPTSPIISNMICSKMDYELQQLAYEERCRYSRYADDIVFSTTKNIFPINIIETETGGYKIGSKINKIINNNGFVINLDKFKVRPSTKRQEVTGLIVNEFPNVKRSFIKQVRMMLHIWNKFGLDDANKKYIAKYGKKFYKSLRGKIEFIKFIKTKESNVYNVLAEKFNDMANKPILETVEVKNWPEEEFIAAGEEYKGINFLNQVFSMAQKEIFILDKYLSGNVISLLEEQINRKKSLLVKIFISKAVVTKYNNCLEEIKKLIKLHPTTQIDCREGILKQAGGLHGRFIIIDGVEVYSSGHSLGELGKRSDKIGKIREKRVKENAIIDLESIFNNAIKIIL